MMTEIHSLVNAVSDKFSSAAAALRRWWNAIYSALRIFFFVKGSQLSHDHI